MVVGERSGDQLAKALISALQSHCPKLKLEGVLGPRLLEFTQIQANPLYPMERLSVIGIIEPLLRLPELYMMRRSLVKYFSDPSHRPDLFIGVDAPDFNLGLERLLRERGIRTVHYVSPTVWAWRQGRVHAIKKAVDLMLALYPFEEKFYQDHGVPVCFTGHPFADEIPLHIDSQAAKTALAKASGIEISKNQTVIGLLPGSRASELKNLAPLYIEAAKLCYQKARNHHLIFIAPLVSEQHQQQFDLLCRQIAPEVPIQTVVQQSRQVMAASSAVLVTSGSATLEVMLHKKPMVVAYRLNPLTYQIGKRMLKVPYISQPNLLANEGLVPEFIQHEVTAENLSQALLNALNEALDENKKHQYRVSRFQEIHENLRRNAAETGAKAIQNLMHS